MRDLEFQVGDQVFLRISPWKGVLRFRKEGKLSPRYMGPYEIMERIGEVAYQLRLPPKLARIHDVFHVSMLCKYIAYPSNVLRDQIVDRKDQVLRNKVIPLVKVLSMNHSSK